MYENIYNLQLILSSRYIMQAFLYICLHEINLLTSSMRVSDLCLNMVNADRYFIRIGLFRIEHGGVYFKKSCFHIFIPRQHQFRRPILTVFHMKRYFVCADLYS